MTIARNLLPLPQSLSFIEILRDVLLQYGTGDLMGWDIRLFDTDGNELPASGATAGTRLVLDAPESAGPVTGRLIFEFTGEDLTASGGAVHRVGFRDPQSGDAEIFELIFDTHMDAGISPRLETMIARAQEPVLSGGGPLMDYITTVPPYPTIGLGHSGSNGADFLQGSDRNDDLSGGFGNDTLLGEAGDDTLFSGFGDDVLSGGPGNNTLNGGPGNDTAILDGVTLDRIVLEPRFERTIERSTGQDWIQGIENLITGAGDDTVSGGRDDNVLETGAGDDILYGDGLKLTALPGLSAQVYRLYQAALGREPDVAGHLDWVTQRFEGDVTRLETGAAFVNSREFQNTYGTLGNEGFVDLLYQNVLGRAGDAAGRQGWIDTLAAGASRAEVVLGFSDSREFIRATQEASDDWTETRTDASWSETVFAIFQVAVGRNPNMNNFLAWTNLLTQGRDTVELTADLWFSQEGQNLYGGLDNTAFVETLYRTALGREADAGGLSHWVARLDAGNIFQRPTVMWQFMQGAEATRIIEAQTLRWMWTRGADDVLDGGPGTNVLTGGLLSDTFVFDQSDAGTHTVLDLEAWDRLDFNGFGYTPGTAAEALSHMTQVGTDVVFTDQGTTVIFAQTALSDFTDGMFI